jgi:MFS family permease
MGLSLGGLLPCIASVIRHNVPERVAGNMLGYSTSAQYTGQVAGRCWAASWAGTSACARCSWAPAC